MPLDVTEYGDVAVTVRGERVLAGQEPHLRNQQVAITNESVACEHAFSDTTTLVRVHADADCRIAIGRDPEATGASPKLAAGSTEYFGVYPGHKIAVIEAE